MMRFPTRFAIAALIGAISPATCVRAQDDAGVRYAELPSTAYAVVAEIQAKPGMEEALREATLPLIAKVRAEPNTPLYFLQEDRERPGHFFFYEIFATQADFEAHNRTPHVQAWFARLPELADGPVKVVRLHILNGRP